MNVSREVIDLEQWCQDCDSRLTRPTLSQRSRSRKFDSRLYRRLPRDQQKLWCLIVSGTLSLAVALPLVSEPLTSFYTAQLHNLLSLWPG